MARAKAKNKSTPRSKLSKKLEISVVGLLYRVTPATLRELKRELPIRCRLEREPGNKHDPNAIRVLLDQKPRAKFHIGYLPHGIAAEFAPRMDDDDFPFNVVWLISLSGDFQEGKLLLSKEKIPGN